MITIEDAEDIRIPDSIEHLPPDMIIPLLNNQRFTSDSVRGQSYALLQSSSDESNVMFLQACASADVFALGVVLLQITTGSPV